MMGQEAERGYGSSTALCTKSGVNPYLFFLTSLLLFLLALILAAILAVALYKGDENPEMCVTPGCIHAASTVLKYIDPSADPCHDFYQFACGGFLKENNIREDKTSIDSFTIVREKVRDQLKTIIEDPRPASKLHDIIKKMYTICMNTTDLDVKGMEVVQKLMKDLGGWPLLEGEGWNPGKFEWKELIYKLRKIGYGTSYFVGFGVGTDKKNSTRRMISIGEAHLSISREFLIKGLEEKLVKAFFDYAVDIATLFGIDKEVARREINETLQFEIALADICLPREKTRNSTDFYHPMAIEELQFRYPYIPWLEYITNVLDIPDIEITEDEVVNVAVPKYFLDLEKLLRQTPKRVLANFIMNKVALSTVGYLPESFRQRAEDYGKVVSGRTETPPRWQSCTSAAVGSVYFAMGAAYIRNFFNENSKKHAMEMVESIKNEFIKILKDNKWMDEQTKAKALEKAEKMNIYIGYPDELLDDKKVEKEYLNLEIDFSSYLRAQKSLSLFGKDYHYKTLREPINKTDWTAQPNPTVINAFYSSRENTIKFPAGILQGIFFDADRPRYLNYGGIGVIIGHEITHGFDDRGRQYDADGNLMDWWQEDTKKSFAKRAQCIIDQYGNYTVPEVNLNLNGINTQGENIADNGGLKEAYLAYQSWVARNGREPRLPGVPYSPNQLFWISHGNVWCEKVRNETLKIKVTTSSHSPSRYRVWGPFMNSKFFAKDFGCAVGTRMNPKKKCQVW